MQSQFENIRSKFRKRFWSLIHLKKSGISGCKLFRMYCVFVRSVIESNCVIYHSMLSKLQSNEIEKMQKRVLRLCFGFDTSYTETCAAYNIERLDERRVKATRRFVTKAMNSTRFSSKWFRRRDNIDNNLRSRRPFVENRAATARYQNSPLVYMQRLANDIITGN